MASLLTTAVNDGASAVWLFSEASGNVVNQKGNTAYDLIVDANTITRGITSPVPAHLKGMANSGANGAGSPNYGNIYGVRPSYNGLNKYALEMVVKVPSYPGASRYAAEMRGGGGITLAAMSINAAGTVTCSIDPRGGNNSATLASAINTSWHHVLFGLDYDGVSTWRHRGYFDATSVYGVDMGGISTVNVDTATWGLSFGGLYQLTTFNVPVQIAFAAIYPDFPSAAIISAHKVLALGS